MRKKILIFHWLPRILGIIAILFISLFAADAFGPGRSIWDQILAFIIHLIPSFILTALLIIAWKWELAGGIIFMIIGLGLSPFVFMHNYQMNNSIWMSLGIIMLITFPFALVGALFIASHKIKKRNPPENT
jgi:cell division protein FtsW (lipid II flippase)